MMKEHPARYTLDRHVEADPRILSVYETARRLYDRERLYHHNMEHVSRDLYRALVIAEDEGTVRYGVLIPAVLLHDVGFCDPECGRLGHDVAGVRMASGLLKEIGYDEATNRQICHCIRAHKGKAELPQSLEAKILYDADVLEKAALVLPILGGKIVCEFGESIEEYLEREAAHRLEELKRGFYTQKARELDGGRLAEVHALYCRIRKEISEERPDFSVHERDLWIRPPAGLDA